MAAGLAQAKVTITGAELRSGSPSSPPSDTDESQVNGSQKLNNIGIFSGWIFLPFFPWLL